MCKLFFLDYCFPFNLAELLDTRWKSLLKAPYLYYIVSPKMDYFNEKQEWKFCNGNHLFMKMCNICYVR